MSLSTKLLSYAYRPGPDAAAEFALRDISLDVPRGSLTGLLGPNGCGKTTLLKLLSGVIRPDSGTVTVDGNPLSGIGRRQIARQIAVVPQETHPAFDFSVRSEEHTSELQSQSNLVCRLLLEKKKH